MTWPQHPDKPLPPIGSPGPRVGGQLALWPIAERAVDLVHDQPIPAREHLPYRGRRRAVVDYSLARTIVALGTSAFLIWLAFLIGNLPVWS